jgi:hypothetical protein
VTREEIADIIKPDAFSPFVIVTGSGSRFSVSRKEKAETRLIHSKVTKATKTKFLNPLLFSLRLCVFA